MKFLPFCNKPQCVKCGSRNINRIYHKAGHYDNYDCNLEYGTHTEHHDLHCRDCHYEWVEKIKGAAFEAPATGEGMSGLAEMQKHRDAWRGYAYGLNEKPMDYLDGNMVDRPPTFLETNALLLHQSESQLSTKNAQGEELRELISTQKCSIIHSGYPSGFTCLDKAAKSKEHASAYAPEHREAVMALKYACLTCRLKDVLSAPPSQALARLRDNERRKALLWAEAHLGEGDDSTWNIHTMLKVKAWLRAQAGPPSEQV